MTDRIALGLPSPSSCGWQSISWLNGGQATLFLRAKPLISSTGSLSGAEPASLPLTFRSFFDVSDNTR
jgi:hypothetical protein